MRTFYSNGKKTKDILERAKNKPVIVDKPDNFDEEAVQLIYDELNNLKTTLAEKVEALQNVETKVEELAEKVEALQNVETKVEEQEKQEEEQEGAPKTQTDSEKLSKKVK